MSSNGKDDKSKKTQESESPVEQSRTTPPRVSNTTMSVQPDSDQEEEDLQEKERNAEQRVHEENDAQEQLSENPTMEPEEEDVLDLQDEATKAQILAVRKAEAIANKQELEHAKQQKGVCLD